jgi:hypothetical protein
MLAICAFSVGEKARRFPRPMTAAHSGVLRKFATNPGSLPLKSWTSLWSAASLLSSRSSDSCLGNPLVLLARFAFFFLSLSAEEFLFLSLPLPLLFFSAALSLRRFSTFVSSPADLAFQRVGDETVGA